MGLKKWIFSGEPLDEKKLLKLKDYLDLNSLMIIKTV